MLQALGFILGLDKLLIGLALMSARSIAQITGSIDLVSEVHLEEVLLLLLHVELLLALADLIEQAGVLLLPADDLRRRRRG